MKALLELLIYGHIHRWREDDRVPIVSSEFGGKIGIAVYCTCEKCGEPKRFHLA